MPTTVTRVVSIVGEPTVDGRTIVNLPAVGNVNPVAVYRRGIRPAPGPYELLQIGEATLSYHPLDGPDRGYVSAVITLTDGAEPCGCVPVADVEADSEWVGTFVDPRLLLHNARVRQLVYTSDPAWPAERLAELRALMIPKLDIGDRDALVAHLGRCVVPEDKWGDRDSASAHEQLGRLWALLKAGCQYLEEAVDTARRQDIRTFRVEVTYKGFAWFEHDDHSTETFYVPTPWWLDECAGSDWYC